MKVLVWRGLTNKEKPGPLQRPVFKHLHKRSREKDTVEIIIYWDYLIPA